MLQMYFVSPSMEKFIVFLVVVTGSMLQLVTPLGSSASPPPPQVASSHDLCVNYILGTPSSLYDYPSYRFLEHPEDPAEECAAWAAAAIAFDLPYKKLVSNGKATPMLKTFSEDAPYICTETHISFCANFASLDDIDAFLEAARRTTLRQSVQGFQLLTCRTIAGGYTFQITVNSDGSRDGGQLEGAATCWATQNQTFPSCQCDTRRGSTGLYAKPEVTVEGGRRKDSKLYCFNLDALPEEELVESNCAVTKLRKVELLADYALRANLTGVRLTPKDGRAKWGSWSWSLGPARADTLKITPLSWSAEEATGGQVCLELTGDLLLTDFCLVPEGGPCFVSLFSDNKDCCPVFTSTETVPVGDSDAP